MKNLIRVFVVSIFYLISNTCNSQFTFNPLTDCPDITVEETSLRDYGGLLKPERTDLNGLSQAPPEARLNVLLVFVQFSNESGESDEWPIGDSAIYMHDLLAENKDTVGDYWNRYDQNTETLSDWFQEVSMGTMHVTGRAYNIILDHTDTYYDSNGIAVMNSEIYQKLEAFGSINWNDYDLWWKYGSGDSLFRYQRDGYIDMIFKIHRTKGNTFNLFDGSGGFAYLKGNVYHVIAGTGDTLLITPGYSEIGSGLTIFGTAGGPVGKLFAYNVARHEYGHYLLGSHRVCGIMGQGDGFLNPWESYRLGYMSKILVNFSTPSYSLYDYASRNRNGQILQVPIQDSTEFFIITNRSKVSNYDVMMYGDTAQGDPFKDVANYGKGLYIYHSVGILGLGGWDYSSTIYQECADGLYNYTQTGFDAPVWDPSNYWLPVLVPSSVSYNNDSSYVCDPNCAVNLNNTDDRNAKGLTISNVVESKWFSKGKKPNLDKMYTNENENWTSRSHLGDRYDAWNVGFNEIFSPYSSPNTNTWVNGNSGIFIWYYNYTGDSPPNLAYVKIYKAGSGGFSENSILHLTPPSRPMNIVVDYYLETEDIMRPIVTWNHNKEPDMLRDDLKKRYKIWRATASSMASVPVNYILLKTLDIDSGTAPVYIDTSIIALGSYFHGTGGQMQYPVRYTVQAIDKYQDSSVRSDFGSAIGLLYCGDACAFGEDNNLQNEQSPKKYSLNQNYPNPFNPVTKIQYDLPNDNFVTIKIYDILGKELMNLVNEFKQAGSYSVTFDATNYPSGVYYYKIKTGSHSGAGSFVQVRKMILIE